MEFCGRSSYYVRTSYCYKVEDEVVRLKHVGAVSSSSANYSAQKWRVNNERERRGQLVWQCMNYREGTK